MIMFRFFLFILILPFENFAQDASILLKEAQQYELQMNENAAFQKYSECLRLQPNNLVVLCKCSELCSRIGNRQTEKAKKIDYFKAARTYANAALRMNPTSSEANFVMAFALGRLTLISSGKEKIGAVKEIQYYAEASIKGDSNNFKPYHVLGKWNYEVSDLSLTERSLAKWFYGGLPPASLQKAIEYYEKCLSLSPNFLLNYLELGKAYYRNGERKKAVALLTRMLTLPNRMADDSRIKEEGRQLLSKWS
jgi:tetratricopeptide (TPR) repeat protein